MKDSKRPEWNIPFFAAIDLAAQRYTEIPKHNFFLAFIASAKINVAFITEIVSFGQKFLQSL